MLNVVGGDGITTNADEIEVNVDDSTIELSATDGSGSIRIKDSGVTNQKLAGSISNDKLSNSSYYNYFWEWIKWWWFCIIRKFYYFKF